MNKALNQIVVAANSRATRIISGFVGLALVGSLYIGVLPQVFVSGALTFLAMHIVNQLYFAIDGMFVPTCHRCGKMLHPRTIQVYPRHVCKLKVRRKGN